MSLFNTVEISFKTQEDYQKWMLKIECPIQTTYGYHKVIIHMEHPKSEQAVKLAKAMGGKVQ